MQKESEIIPLKFLKHKFNNENFESKVNFTFQNEEFPLFENIDLNLVVIILNMETNFDNLDKIMSIYNSFVNFKKIKNFYFGILTIKLKLILYKIQSIDL